MILNIVLISIIVASVIALGYLVIRKFPQLRSLDVDTLPEARKAKIRDRILLDRMRRKTKSGREIVKKKTFPALSKVKRGVKGVFKKIYDLEKKYQKQAERKPRLIGPELQSKIRALLEDAKKLLKEDKYQEAEKVYIEIISLNHKNIEAYKNLADVYIELKEYKQAIQTLLFAIKLETKNSKAIFKKLDNGQKYKTISNSIEMAELYCKLGIVNEKLEDNEKALQNYKSSVKVDPNNPKYLNKVLDISIILKNKILALEMLKRLSEVNPENQKLKEYSEKISAL